MERKKNEHASKHNRPSHADRKDKAKKDVAVGRPFNVVHRVHVDEELQWGVEKGDLTDLFQLDTVLGKGAFGTAYLARSKDSGVEICIKVVGFDNESDMHAIEQEIEILRTLRRSDYVVGYLGSSRKGSELWIMMELCAGGSLTDILDAGIELTEDQISLVMRYCLEGLQYLHQEGKIHRDIKSGNILLSGSGAPKLADFGVSAQLTELSQKRSTVVGTPLWMAPEVLTNERYDRRADIWSLGITCIELCEGMPPRSEMHPMRALYFIPKAPPPTLKDPDRWSDSLHNFLSLCLTKDPQLRPDSTSLLKHPFITESKAANPSMAESIRRSLFALSMMASNAKKAAKEQMKAKRGRGSSTISSGGSGEGSNNYSSGGGGHGMTSIGNDDIEGGTFVVNTATPPESHAALMDDDDEGGMTMVINPEQLGNSNNNDCDNSTSNDNDDTGMTMMIKPKKTMKAELTSTLPAFLRNPLAGIGKQKNSDTPNPPAAVPVPDPVLILPSSSSSSSSSSDSKTAKPKHPARRAPPAPMKRTPGFAKPSSTPTPTPLHGAAPKPPPRKGKGKMNMNKNSKTDGVEKEKEQLPGLLNIPVSHSESSSSANSSSAPATPTTLRALISSTLRPKLVERDPDTGKVVIRKDTTRFLAKRFVIEVFLVLGIVLVLKLLHFPLPSLW